MGFLDDLLGLGKKKKAAASPVVKPVVNPQKPQTQNISNAAAQKPKPARNLSLEDELDTAWDYVQKKFYCFDLPYPEIIESGETNTACIDMGSHKIKVRKDFVGYLAKKGLSYETIFRGLLEHEVGHFKNIPWDLKNFMMLLYQAEQVSSDKKDVITNYFMDVSLNLDLILNKREDYVHKIYAAFEKTSRIDILLSHLYAFKTGMDFNSPKLPAGLDNHLKELGKIKFTSKRRVYDNIKRFAQIVKDVLEEDRNNPLQGNSTGGKSQGNNGAGQGQGKENNESDNSDDGQSSNPGADSGNDSGEGKDYSMSNIDDFGLRAFDEKDVERVLKEIAKEMENPSSYKKLYDFVRKEEKSQAKKAGENSAVEGSKQANGNKPGSKNRGIVIGAGKASGIDFGLDANDSIARFYTAKAEAYEVGIEDKDVLGGGETSKTELRPWQVDDSYSSVDIFNSYGKFFPEITKSWADSGSQGEKPVKATPDLLVVIDSSGSMPDPKTELSSAVVGGLCAARQYLKKGSKVSIANFSDTTSVDDFSRDYARITKKLLHYQGGGTELINERAYNLISKNDKEVDIMLISDGYIANYNSVIRELLKRKNTNRITILEISSFGFGGGFSAMQSRHPNDKVKVYPIKNEDDIPKVVVGDLKQRGLI